MTPLTRSQAKREVRRRSGKMIANDGTDILMSLDYSLFLKDLLVEAERLSDIDGASEILPSHIQQARIIILKRYKG